MGITTEAAPGPTGVGARRLVWLAACVLALCLGPPAAWAQAAGPDTVTLVGSLQSELGCPGDWQPECVTTHLQPVAGSPGIWRGSFDVPAGSYEYKVAINDSWDENYGAGGAPGGANIPITARGGMVTFTYDDGTHVIGDDTPKPLDAQQGAHWVRTGLIAWSLAASHPEYTYRLQWARAGGLSVQGAAVAGGSSAPLTRDAAGLPADVRAQDPQLASYGALQLPAATRRQAADILTGEIVAAAYDASGNLVQTSGVQIPRVLDELYAGAAREQLGPTWS